MCSAVHVILLMYLFRCAEEIATVHQQYPAEPFKYLDPRYNVLIENL